MLPHGEGPIEPVVRRRDRLGLHAVVDPVHVRKHLARNPGDPLTGPAGGTGSAPGIERGIWRCTDKGSRIAP